MLDDRLIKSSSLKHKSLEHSLMHYMLLFGLFITLILGSIELYRTYNADIKLLNEQFENIEHAFLNGISNSLWTVDYHLAQVQINGINALPNIEYVEIRSEGNIFATSGKLPNKSSMLIRKFDLISTELNNSINLGQLTVIANLSKVYTDSISNFGNVLLYVGLTIFLILLLLSILVKRLILRHFEKISHFMKNATWENIETPLELDRKTSNVYRDELDVLVTSFNYQRTELHSKHKQLLLSESRYLDLANGSLQGMFIHVDFEPVFINNACAKIFGFKNKDEFLATGNFLKHLAPYERKRIVDYKKRRLAGEETPTEYEVDCLHKDGSILHILIITSVIEWHNGTAILGTFMDITERKKMERELRLSEERLSKIFESSPDVIIVSRLSDGMVLDANKNFEHVFGHSKEEWSGKTAVELNLWAHPEDRPRIVEEIKANGGIKYLDVQYRKKNNDISDCYLSCDVIEIKNELCLVTTIRDTSKQKAVQEALKSSEETLFKIYESIPDVVLVIRIEDGVILDTNKNVLPILGFTKEEVVGKTALELNAWVNLEDRSTIMHEINKNGEIKYLDTQYRKKDGAIADCYLSASTITIKNEPCIVVTIRDITEQKVMQNLLSLSEEKFSKAFRVSPIVFVITHISDGTILEINQAFEKLSGWSHENAIGKTTIELNFWSIENQNDAIEEIQQKGSIKNREVRFLTKSGEERYCLLSSEMIDIDGEPCYLSIVDDITDRKQAEDEIIQSRERLRQLSNRLEQVREEERIGIARELHDELGQSLTGLKFDLTWLSDQIPDTKITDERIQSMIKNIDSNIDVIRRISSELRPPILDDLGIDAAIEWATEKFSQRTMISYKLNIDCDDLDMNKIRDIVIFRIYQETLTNIARHSQAKKFDANIRVVDNELRLTVIDDGIGITKKQIQDNNSIGLIGMQERAASISATVTIKNATNGGTEVNLIVPLGNEI